MYFFKTGKLTLVKCFNVKFVMSKIGTSPSGMFSSMAILTSANMKNAFKALMKWYFAGSGYLMWYTKILLFFSDSFGIGIKSLKTHFLLLFFYHYKVTQNDFYIHIYLQVFKYFLYFWRSRIPIGKYFRRLRSQRIE